MEQVPTQENKIHISFVGYLEYFLKGIEAIIPWKHVERLHNIKAQAESTIATCQKGHKGPCHWRNIGREYNLKFKFGNFDIKE